MIQPLRAFLLLKFAFAFLGLGVATNGFSKDSKVAIEFDPGTTALGARNLAINFEPAFTPHYSFGLIAFQADFPGWLTDFMSPANKDKGFETKITKSAGFIFDYYTDQDGKGLHFGVIGFKWNYEVSKGDNTTTFSNAEVLPRVGYRFFPMDAAEIYLDAFGGLQSEFRLGGENTIGDDEFETTPLLPFATVHLGLRL